MQPLAPGEFATDALYLNTASYGLPPARGLAAVRAITDDWAAGRAAPNAHDDLVDSARAAFARLLTGATPDDVAIGSTVAALIGPVAAALPTGAEVLVPTGDFASVTGPFHHRRDLNVRTVPLDDLAASVRSETALVAASLVQSADGRILDLAELRTATTAHHTRLLLDASQAAGWLPLNFDDADYWVCATFKWLLGARSVTFFAAAPAAAAALHPLAPGWYAAADRWSEMYAPQRLAPTTRRFDDTPDWLGVAATLAGLELVDHLTVDTIRAHDLTLADRFRTGLTDLGLPPIPAPGSPIVTVPGAAHLAPALAPAGIVATARNGNLRFSFHLYNTTADVDHTLKTLAAA
ncbi:aminotransferase class V-fold PLP-dependent enzyme [Nocardia sp. alder85J]|uniref:aminotransferase class V-fold PLP-dependent enzyme n=1 Tax=Nocardia sp. alder85J TaxID=2862949 RepID=UPI001CD6E059|nr:aminotransferase class V-fold PLP-dependent enzyme [Nocardia sp. alder85J]MCX4096940.1 aminotransferase class V-fold PLP-dependent enzyme [Nocardia sp. alder85J]